MEMSSAVHHLTAASNAKDTMSVPELQERLQECTDLDERRALREAIRNVKARQFQLAAVSEPIATTTFGSSAAKADSLMTENESQLRTLLYQTSDYEEKRKIRAAIRELRKRKENDNPGQFRAAGMDYHDDTNNNSTQHSMSLGLGNEERTAHSSRQRVLVDQSQENNGDAMNRRQRGDISSFKQQTDDNKRREGSTSNRLNEDNVSANRLVDSNKDQQYGDTTSSQQHDDKTKNRIRTGYLRDNGAECPMLLSADSAVQITSSNYHQEGTDVTQGEPLLDQEADLVSSRVSPHQPFVDSHGQSTFDKRTHNIKPEITSHLADTKSMDGSHFVALSVSFACPPGCRTPEVHWYRDGELIMPSEDFHQTVTTGTCQLIIKELFPDDAGTYKCTLQNDFGKAESVACLVVEENPSFKAPEFMAVPKDVMVEDGKPLELHVEVSGSPEPHLKWFKGKELLKNGRDFRQSYHSGQGTLLIYEVYPDDSGVYKCLASNAAGECEVCFCVHVTVCLSVASGLPKLSHELEDLTVTDGDADIPMSCSLESRASFATVAWYKDAKMLRSGKDFKQTFDGVTAKLVITEIYPDDAGVYKCILKVGNTELVTTAVLKVTESLSAEESLEEEFASGICTSVDTIIANVATDTVTVTSQHPESVANEVANAVTSVTIVTATAQTVEMAANEAVNALSIRPTNTAMSDVMDVTVHAASATLSRVEESSLQIGTMQPADLATKKDGYATALKAAESQLHRITETAVNKAPKTLRGTVYVAPASKGSTVEVAPTITSAKDCTKAPRTLAAGETTASAGDAGSLAMSPTVGRSTEQKHCTTTQSPEHINTRTAMHTSAQSLMHLHAADVALQESSTARRAHPAANSDQAPKEMADTVTNKLFAPQAVSATKELATKVTMSTTVQNTAEATNILVAESTNAGLAYKTHKTGDTSETEATAVSSLRKQTADLTGKKVVLATNHTGLNNMVDDSKCLHKQNMTNEVSEPLANRLSSMGTNKHVPVYTGTNRAAGSEGGKMVGAATSASVVNVLPKTARDHSMGRIASSCEVAGSAPEGAGHNGYNTAATTEMHAPKISHFLQHAETLPLQAAKRPVSVGLEGASRPPKDDLSHAPSPHTSGKEVKLGPKDTLLSTHRLNNANSANLHDALIGVTNIQVPMHMKQVILDNASCIKPLNSAHSSATAHYDSAHGATFGVGDVLANQTTAEFASAPSSLIGATLTATAGATDVMDGVHAELEQHVLVTERSDFLSSSNLVSGGAHDVTTSHTASLGSARDHTPITADSNNSYLSIIDENELQKILDKTEDFDERKKIRARIRELKELRKAERENDFKRREEERAAEAKKRLADAELEKKKKLEKYREFSKSTIGSLPVASDEMAKLKIAEAEKEKKLILEHAREAAAISADHGAKSDLAVKHRLEAADKAKEATLKSYDKVTQQEAERKKESAKPIVPQAILKPASTTATTGLSKPLASSAGKQPPPSTGKGALAAFKQMDKANNPNPAQKKPKFGGDSKLMQVADALLRWCRFITKGYENISIDNYTTSWNDGMAFCALIHHFYPEAFDYSALDPKNKRHNFTLAFETAEKNAGISQLLDVEDMVRMQKPDWKCVLTYIQTFYSTIKELEQSKAQSPVVTNSAVAEA